MASTINRFLTCRINFSDDENDFYGLETVTTDHWMQQLSLVIIKISMITQNAQHVGHRKDKFTRDGNAVDFTCNFLQWNMVLGKI